MRPPALGNVMGSAVDVHAGSMASELDRRRTPAGARVAGSSATTIGASVGVPAIATMPRGPTRRRSSSVNGDSTSPASRPGAMWKIRSRPRGAADGDDRTVGQEAIRRAIEDPCRVGELGLQRRKRLQPRPVHQPVEVPPTAPVADEVQHAVGRPLRLGDRLVRAAGRQFGDAREPIVADRGDSQPGRVPGHVGVVPLEPREWPTRRVTGGAQRGSPGPRRGRAASARRRAGPRRSTRPAGRRRCGPRARPGTGGGRRRSGGRRTDSRPPA